MLINFHHMINEYRPHQARESLIELMQSKLDRIRQETAAIRASVDQARRALVGLGSIEIPTDEQLFLDQVGSPNDLKAREAEEQREQGLWAALDKRGL